MLQCTGYTIVTHTGTSWGYGALLTLVPDLGLGIHTSITGPDDGYRARRALHLYILDLLMGQHPWLNTTSACTFPDGPNPRLRWTRPQISRFGWTDQDSMIKFNFTLYEGIYGNYGFGNVSVVYRPESQQLVLLYGPLGVWLLHPTAQRHVFVGEGVDHVWCFYMDVVQFSVDNALYTPANNILIPSFEPDVPPVFIRNLQDKSCNGGHCLSHTLYIYLLWLLVLCYLLSN